jgi:hypothetical protein
MSKKKGMMKPGKKKGSENPEKKSFPFDMIPYRFECFESSVLHVMSQVFLFLVLSMWMLES